MPEAGSLWRNGFVPSEASSLCNENEQIVMVANILPLYSPNFTINLLQKSRKGSFV